MFLKNLFLSFLVKPVFYQKEANESNLMTTARCIDFHNATGVGHLVFTIASLLNVDYTYVPYKEMSNVGKMCLETAKFAKFNLHRAKIWHHFCLEIISSWPCDVEFGQGKCKSLRKLVWPMASF